MAVRAATLALVALAAFAATGTARGQDDPACAQFKEPMAYNACLARHGPKANDLGTHPGHAGPGRGAEDGVWRGKASARASTARHWRPLDNHGRAHMEFHVQ